LFFIIRKDVKMDKEMLKHFDEIKIDIKVNGIVLRLQTKKLIEGTSYHDFVATFDESGEVDLQVMMQNAMAKLGLG